MTKDNARPGYGAPIGWLFGCREVMPRTTIERVEATRNQGTSRPVRPGQLAAWMLLGLALLVGPSLGSAAPQAIPFWQARDEASTKQIDHSPWQAILDRHLLTDHPSGINRFDYAGLQANSADMRSLDSYLASLQATDPRRLSSAEQFAYWINFYNALTVRVVAGGYPVESIRDIHESWLAFGPWDDVQAEVAGQELTLNDIEHRILRPIWGDSRIHYAVNCASYGCPNLAGQAYTAANLEELLEQGARDYVNHPRGVSLVDGDLVLSAIYDWYQEDFGGSEEAVVEHLIRYASTETAAKLLNYGRVADYEYDWRLNEP